MALGKRPSVRQEALFVAAAGGVGGWGGGSGVRQGLPLEQDDDGVGGPGAARLRERARARSAELEAEQGSPEAGLREPAADSGRARQGAAEDAGREARALVRAPAGDGRASPRARSRPRGHPQAECWFTSPPSTSGCSCEDASASARHEACRAAPPQRKLCSIPARRAPPLPFCADFAAQSPLSSRSDASWGRFKPNSANSARSRRREPGKRPCPAKFRRACAKPVYP